ncbi:ZrgA family zinc uptake protein [Catenovulum agarivorans]|uniref:ZrgA family zinc uptake protein n=1 Tax=Catenovulum agarivorans TaxID=1172192 RepID=UPI0002D25A97|nr:DUF2796 domain-containing protein [Catenovulum agarivorans]
MSKKVIRNTLTKALVTSLAVATTSINTVNAAEQGAHVHGYAQLTVAMENTELHLEFSVPSESVVGFEYKATSEAELIRVKAAQKLLSNPDKLATFAEGNCQLINSEIDVSAVLPEDKHADEHGHNNHNNHKHEDEHHNENKHSSTHSEILVSYQFKCQNVSEVTNFDVHVFKYFERLQQIQTRWITDRKQGAKTLTANEASFQLK